MTKMPISRTVEDVELLLDDLQLVGRQRLGLGIFSFSKHLVKLFGLEERDPNGIELNSSFDFPADRPKKGPSCGEKAALAWRR